MIIASTARSYHDCHLLCMSNCRSSNFTAICWATSEVVHHFVDNNGFRSRETLNYIISSGIWGPTRYLSLKITNSLAIFRLRKPLLNQVGQPRDFNPGAAECESRALPRSHLAWWISFVMYETSLSFFLANYIRGWMGLKFSRHLFYSWGKILKKH